MKITLDQINKIPDVQAREKLKRDIIEGYEFQKKEAAKQDFLTFVKRMWPQFIEGKHHKIISEKFNKICESGKTILIVSQVPYHRFHLKTVCLCQLPVAYRGDRRSPR